MNLTKVHIFHSSDEMRFEYVTHTQLEESVDLTNEDEYKQINDLLWNGLFNGFIGFIDVYSFKGYGIKTDKRVSNMR